MFFFCKEYECNEDNPLMCLCLCNKYFHFKCLNKRIKLIMKYKEKTKIKNYYITREFFCKICNLNYPLKFKIEENKIIYELVNIDIPKRSNYMILESINNKHCFDTIKFIFIIELNKNKIGIGRMKKNDIIIFDPSISTNHAEMIYNKGKIFLINKSKTFGTLISIRKPIKINDNIIELQLGNTVIEAKHINLGEFKIL